MSVRLLLITGLAALLLGGCRRDPHLQVYLDNVNAEKRLLEDTLYDLQYDYECSIDEVEKLRGELTRLKSGSASGGTSRPAPGGSGKSTAPATSGDDLFPEFPDLKPPTVEQGTPAQPKPPADTESPKELDDLEPPVLDLGDEKSSAAAAPKPIDQEVTRSASDESDTAASKPAARWTPRAQRPPETPAQRINVAESPGQRDSAAPSPASGGSADSAAGTTSENPSADGAASKQAQRPQWRPYR